MQGNSSADSNINAWLVEDTLYLSPKTSWDIEPLHIKKGNEIFKLNDLDEPIHHSELQYKGNAIFPFQLNQLNINLDGERGIPLKHGINSIDDFVITGKKTLSICIGKRSEEHTSELQSQD